jgi:hypothetical protein
MPKPHRETKAKSKYLLSTERKMRRVKIRGN